MVSGTAGPGAPLRRVRQAAEHAADAEEAHRATAPPAAAFRTLRPLPQGLPHAQLSQQPQEYLSPPPEGAPAARPVSA